MLVESVAPVVCSAVRTFPLPESVPGGFAYEPKFDGYRALLAHEGGRASMLSRHGTQLAGYFPEVSEHASQMPDGTVLDGELVMWSPAGEGSGARLNFAGLGSRLGASAPRARKLAQTAPAMYVAFDVVFVAGQDLRGHTYDERRVVLEGLGLVDPLAVCPSTADPAQAARWFEDLAVTGVEGLVIKRRTSKYSARGRPWLKLRTLNSVELIAVGLVGSRVHPKQLLLGRSDGTRVRLAAVTKPLTPRQQAAVAPVLAIRGDDQSPWPVPLPPTWYPGPPGTRDQPLAYRVLEPFAVEVAADVARERATYRHPVTFLRLRPDLDPNRLL